MSSPLIDPKLLDLPEHFDDAIRAYKSSTRYIPKPLQQQLFELARHRCTICLAPWLQIHHIDELSEGGVTEYANLIVLCPNCHTRVHADGIPSKDELRQYKLKQELAYEFPIISKLSEAECAYIRNLASVPPEAQITFSSSSAHIVDSGAQDVSTQSAHNHEKFRNLLESGIIALNMGIPVTNSDGKEFHVGRALQPTSKGIKWVRYLAEVGRLP